MIKLKLFTKPVMLIKFQKKNGVSLVESLVAMLLLSFVALFYLNSSKIFHNSQQSLIDYDRHEQLGELIIQGLMEFTKSEKDPYGVVTARGETVVGVDIKTLDVNVDPTAYPQVGDMFVIGGIKGKYKIESIDTNGALATIETVSNISQETIKDLAAIKFIAFDKDRLRCFNGMTLTADLAVGECGDTRSDEVADFQTFWRQALIDELIEFDTATIEVTDGGLIKVTIDGVVLARNVNTCIFTDTVEVAKFIFPGLDEPLVTGIMSGSESPVLHYSFKGIQRTYTDGDDGDFGSGTTTQVDTCNTVSASTCRQNYAKKDYITVFLYRYRGATSSFWQPTGCRNVLNGQAVDWQCPAVEVVENDLSLWFILDEHASYIRENGVASHNDNGFFHFETKNLPENAKILIFDDSSESCQNAITGNACEGRYKWGGAHDGLVIHLDTADLDSLGDIGLEVLSTTYGINNWRVLRSDEPNCLVASGEDSSLHGSWDDREDEMDDVSCWLDIEILETTLDGNITQANNIITLDDSSIFPSSGTVQIENELVSYSANNTSTNQLTISERGVKQCPECIVTSGSVIGTGLAFASNLNINPNPGRKITLSGKPGVGFYGGFLQIGTADANEVFMVDYNSSYDDYDNNTVTIRKRAQKGTAARDIFNGDHASGANTFATNWDNNAVAHAGGVSVKEGNTNTIAAVMPDVGGVWSTISKQGRHTGFTIDRLKKSINLNLSDTAICN